PRNTRKIRKVRCFIAAKFFALIRVFSGQFSLGLVPKRVKVKPVIRRKTRIMLESLGVALHPEVGLLGATIPLQNDHVGEVFEINFIAVPATIEPEKQDNRATHHGSKEGRARWERSWRTQELTLSCLVRTEDAVAQHADEITIV